jgi:ABC-type multidrug transport system fused ATPase/permease subunit
VILDKLSLELEPGKVLALVGPSGQGKSTIMSLILRFYDASEGQILLDHRLDLKGNITGTKFLHPYYSG